MLPVGLGDRGDAVADVQRRLSGMGFVVGPSGVDGVYADETAKAVRGFQQKRGLPETGTVDEVTWRALVEASLRLGDRLLYVRSPFFHGDDIRELQERLNKLGFNCGKVDGVFGRITERAVRDFQKNVDIPSDGIVGDETLAAMAKLKTVLETKSVTSLPRKRPKPFSSAAAFKGREIAVSVIAPTSDERTARTGLDIAMRLKNLLELLDASAQVFEAGSEVPSDGVWDAVVTVEAGAGGASPDGFSVEASPRASSMAVRVALSCGDGEDRLLDSEAFAQKIAVAAFDGLHDFFRSARNGR